VYAYERGGTKLAAAIAVIQLTPAAVIAPMAARLIDRYGSAVGLWRGYALQALSNGATAALMLLHAPSVGVYAAAVLAASAVTLTRPAHGALLPSLVDDPGQLTAANAVTGWLESAGLLIGPALSGALIAIDGPGASFGFFALAIAGSAALVAPVARHEPPPAAEQGATRENLDFGILSALAAQKGMTPLMTIMGVQFFAMGALDVLEVVLAIKVLGLGASGAGYLGAAFGAGGLAGGVAALGLIGRRRVVSWLLCAAILWGLAFVIIGAWPSVVVAFGLLAGAGAARTVPDVAGRTLLQRVASSEVRGRLFGVLEGVAMLSLALGSASVPAFAGAGGTRAALIGTGALLAVCAGATFAALYRLERLIPSVGIELGLLRGSPLFSMLAAPVLEGLARSLTRIEVACGEAVVREGETGGLFYLVGDGELSVTAGGEQRPPLRPGDGFGEIALLRDGIRTATVTATTPVTLYALGREDFLEAVTGSAQASHAAERLIAQRLEGSAGVVA
jgi:MFS family permease